MMRVKNGFILVISLVGFVMLWASPSAAQNLVTNWSFETPDVEYGTRDLFVDGEVPGWGILPSTGTPDGWGYGVYLEIQDHWEYQSINYWDAYDGVQLCELDSGGVASSIYQDLLTTPGQSYSLQFAYSPRPGQQDYRNVLGIMWDGILVDEMSESGIGLVNTSWTIHSYTLTATSNTTRLVFGDLGDHSSYGTFLDAVSVKAVPIPSAVWLLGSGLIGLVGVRRKFKKS